MRRLKDAILMFWITLTKRHLFNVGLMKTVEGMFKFLEETAKNQKPMSCELQMDNIAHILWHEGEERETVLYVWCGVNEINNPIKRLRELAAENERLKSLLNSTPNPEVSDTTKDDSSTTSDKQNKH